MPLLTQNSNLRPFRIWNWTIPAWYTRLEDGTIFKTCPQAGVCAKLCYARNGTYLFKNVKQAHDRNLRMVLDDPDAWQSEINHELSADKFKKTNSPREIPNGLEYKDLDRWMKSWVVGGLPAIRIHDAGDFFAEWYLIRWLMIAEKNPQLLFYCYTKEVTLFKEHEPSFPLNFRFLYSTGGLEDHLITDDDRHADVFPTLQATQDAGYFSQDENDLLAIMLPTNKIGITANNIPHFNKKLAGKTFREFGVKSKPDLDNLNPAPQGNQTLF